MKTFKAICLATLLVLSLSLPAYAGDGHTTGGPVPVPIRTPTTAPGNAELTGVAAAVDGDISFPTLADILWALASIY